MPKFRKKNIQPIEAIQWTGENLDEMIKFGEGNISQLIQDVPTKFLNIKTYQGNTFAEVGDWVVKGINGEFYPCGKSLFLSLYEEVVV